MLTRALRAVLTPLGYELRKIESEEERQGHSVFLHKYVKDDGSFDYERYRQVQVAGNRAKLDWVWVVEPNVVFLSDYIRKLIGPPRFGICHGTRRGKEQEWFRKYLGCDVIGTEIAETAKDFPHTIQWDFHDTKPEWIDATDFIYSNAFDHSHDPEACLNAWMSCVRKGGICILEQSDRPSAGSTELDPFGADTIVMPYLITLWGKGRYGVRELIRAPGKHDTAKFLYFLVIQKF